MADLATSHGDAYSASIILLARAGTVSATGTSLAPSVVSQHTTALLLAVAGANKPAARIIPTLTTPAAVATMLAAKVRLGPSPTPPQAIGTSYQAVVRGLRVPVVASASGTGLNAKVTSHFYGTQYATASGSAYAVTIRHAQPAQQPTAVGAAYVARITSAFYGTQRALASGTAVNATVAALSANNVTDTATVSETVESPLTGVFQTGAGVHCLLHHPDREDWAIEQMRSRHDGALWRFGEYSMFVLLWRIEDFEAGLVGRCPECMTPYGAITDVYKQPMKTGCVTCYGTTFEGGFKARIVRPAMWDMGEATNGPGERGEVVRANAAVQSTHDFRMRTNDFVRRADGTRWHVQGLSTNHLRAGFGFPDKEGTAIGFNYGQVILEDPASNAYAIQIPDTLPQILNVRNPRGGWDFSLYEEIRGPLLPTTPAVAT